MPVKHILFGVRYSSLIRILEQKQAKAAKDRGAKAPILLRDETGENFSHPPHPRSHPLDRRKLFSQNHPPMIPIGTPIEKMFLPAEPISSC